MTSEGPGRDGLQRHIGFRSATALVVANVIGAGIFTTTGFQAADLGNPGWIFALWILGGLLAYCGALCYAELGAAMPEAGAEYVYLRETYGPGFGFMGRTGEGGCAGLFAVLQGDDPTGLDGYIFEGQMPPMPDPPEPPAE